MPSYPVVNEDAAWKLRKHLGDELRSREQEFQKNLRVITNLRKASGF